MKAFSNTEHGDLSEQELQAAARAVREAMLASLPEPEDCEAAFSPGFQRRMSALTARSRRRAALRRVGTTAAAVLLVVLLGTGSWLASDAEARAAVGDWVRSGYGNSSAYYRFHGGEADILPEYEPTWLPEGFAVVSTYRDENQSSTVYMNGSGQGVVISYFRGTEDTQLQIGQTGTMQAPTAVTVNGFPADYYGQTEISDTNNLIWTDAETGVLFGLNSNLDWENLLKIAAFIREK